MVAGFVEDSVWGALYLSVFDFGMCFFVLWFFGLIIKGIKRFG